MSGHTNFTRWINTEAKYILVNGKKEIIEKTFFTSDRLHNSDNFMIKTDKGCYDLSDKRIDFSELSKRNK